MAEKFLGPVEVQRRLNAYDNDEKLLRHLYDFGRLALEEVDKLTERLDGKARVMMVWDAGLSAFIITQVDKLPALARVAAVVAGLLIFVSGFYALLSLRVRPAKSFSDRAWFPEPGKTKSLADLLRHQAWVASEIRARNTGLNGAKGESLLMSQYWFTSAVLILPLIIVLRFLGS